MSKPHERLRCRSRCIRRRTHVVGNGGGRWPANQSDAVSHLPESGLRHPTTVLSCSPGHLPQHLRPLCIMDKSPRVGRGMHLTPQTRHLTHFHDCLPRSYISIHSLSDPAYHCIPGGGGRIFALASRGPSMYGDPMTPCRSRRLCRVPKC